MLNLELLLEGYNSSYPEEKEYKKNILELLRKEKNNAFKRELVSGHVTASAMVLNKEADKFLYFRRHYGATIMYQSFDIICFIVSLMIENYFYHTVKNNKKLNNIWSNLWLKDELEDLEKDIKECKNNNFNNIFTILRKYYIRSDIIEYLEYNLM